MSEPRKEERAVNERYGVNEREGGEESSGTVTVGQGVKVTTECHYLTSSGTTAIHNHSSNHCL